MRLKYYAQCRRVVEHERAELSHSGRAAVRSVVKRKERMCVGGCSRSVFMGMRGVSTHASRDSALALKPTRAADGKGKLCGG